MLRYLFHNTVFSMATKMSRKVRPDPWWIGIRIRNAGLRMPGSGSEINIYRSTALPNSHKNIFLEQVSASWHGIRIHFHRIRIGILTHVFLVNPFTGEGCWWLKIDKYSRWKKNLYFLFSTKDFKLWRSLQLSKENVLFKQYISWLFLFSTG